MDCDFSPSSPHLLPNGLFSPQNRISFELLALSGLSGFSTFKGGKMLIFQGFASSRIVREFPPFSFKVRIATLTRNQVVAQAARGFESHPIRHDHASSRFFRLLAFLFAQIKPPANISRTQMPHHRPPLRLYTAGAVRLRAKNERGRRLPAALRKGGVDSLLEFRQLLLCGKLWCLHSVINRKRKAVDL